MAPGESEFDTPAVGEGEGEGKGSGILPRGRKHAGTFLLRVFKNWEFSPGGVAQLVAAFSQCAEVVGLITGQGETGKASVHDACHYQNQ